MSLADWDETLRELADETGLYQREANVALLTRHGNEQVVEFTERPGAGLAVALPGGRAVPISTWVQSEVLRLPVLARQIQRVLEKFWADPYARPTPFVEGAAEYRTEEGTLRLERVAQDLPPRLGIVPGTTHILQLMAAAGRGKTALIEHLAMDAARKYQPEEHPYPLVLPVDLLGRYVGTVDDAIAGSLNNTYLFPGLSQKDIVLSLRRKWIILALDGFDELVARVGARDAFNRITELLDQLRASGTIILSARAAFFELYQISSAIRTYLQPRVGSFTTSAASLLRWERRQGLDVFQALGSERPDEDLDALLEAFGHDEEIVYHPFHLTRLARLWVREGERFPAASGQELGHARSKYVIEKYIDREVTEKWIDRDLKPLLSIEGHIALLGAIAEEMWRSGAFRLSADELRIAAQIGMAEIGTPELIRDVVLERLGTHAALAYREPWFAFSHDLFLHYFLGIRVVDLMRRGDGDAFMAILRARELGEEILAWIGWRWSTERVDRASVVRFLTDRAQEGLGSPAAENLGELCSLALHGYQTTTPVMLRGLPFTGESLRARSYSEVRFEACNFWDIDLSSTTFEHCTFEGCGFAGVQVDKGTKLTGSVLAEDCRLTNLEITDDHSLFAPDAIAAWIGSAGGRWNRLDRDEMAADRRTPGVREDVIHVVERYVKMSRRTWDVAISDVEEKEGEELARAVARVGVDTAVLRPAERATSGPRKSFVRFQVDRDRLLRGQIESTGDSAIDRFWDRLRREFPIR